MKISAEKTMKIASELLSYCHHRGADDFHLEIKLDLKSASYVIKASPADVSDKELERLARLLNAPRQRDVEQDYWELIGESDDYCELTLIGMITDNAIVEYKDQVLLIKVYRST